MHPLNIGVIGAGRIGQLHAANIVRHMPEARLLLVADVIETAAQQCAAQHNAAHCSDYHAVLEHPEVEAVLICSATDTHAQIIADAAAAGKHIFCEKPIALSLASIDHALAAVDHAGVQLQVGFNRRFDASFCRVREAITRGEIGQPELLHLISRDPAPPPLAYIAHSGGLFLDMAIHDYDMARFLLGSEVTEVYATASVMVDPAIGAAGDVDTAVTLLRFSNGVLCTVENSRRAVYGYDQRVEVLGSAGAARIDNAYANTAMISDGQSVRRDLPLHFFLERYRASYHAELAAFVAAVRAGTPVPVSGLDGRAPVAIGLAARRSFAENRPVRIDEVA